MEMTATAESLAWIVPVGSSGSVSGRHGRQHTACDSGTRPPPASCTGASLSKPCAGSASDAEFRQYSTAC